MKKRTKTRRSRKTQTQETHTPTLKHEMREFLINDALARSPKLRKISERVRSAQDSLRRVVDDVAWQRYLNLEELTNARAGIEVRLVFARMLDAFTYAMFEL